MKRCLLVACLFVLLACFSEAYAVEKWICPECGNRTEATRDYCVFCNSSKPTPTPSKKPTPTPTKKPTPTPAPKISHYTLTLLRVVDGDRICLNERANTIEYQCDDDKYAVFSIYGERLSSNSYRWLNGNLGYGCYMAGTGAYDAINKRGILDGQGNELVPCKYESFWVLSDRWIVAMFAPNSSQNNYVNIYYRGTLVKSFNKKELISDFQYSSKCVYAHGDYIRLTNSNGQYVWYDYKMQYQNIGPDNLQEYLFDQATKQVTHIPTGQQAFCSGCKLTSSEVDLQYYPIGQYVYDLQGNIVGDFSKYDSVDLITFYGDDYSNKYVRVCNIIDGEYEYALATVNGKIMTSFGKGSVYKLSKRSDDYIYYYVSKTERYIISTKDWSKMRIPDDSKCYDPYGFAIELGDDKKYTITSAEAGSWDKKYDYVWISSSKAILLKDGDAWGVSSVYNEEIIPCDGTYSSIKLSADGTIIVAHRAQGNCTDIYQVSYR